MLLELYGFPQDFKEIHSHFETGTVTFGWKEIECDRRNGVLLGYELKLFYDDEIYTDRVTASVTCYTVVPKPRHQFFLPKAISVAAINELGVGDYSPPLTINRFGE